MDEKKITGYYYSWDDGNYTNGIVIGFLTKEQAEIHSKKHHPKSDIDIMEIDDVIDIYTGE